MIQCSRLGFGVLVLLLAGLSGGASALRAQDEAALRRELGAIGRKFDAEVRQLEQGFARERIKIESAARERVAAAQRGLQAATGQALAGLAAQAETEGAGDLSRLADTAQASFEQAEAEAERDYWLLPELDARERLARAGIERRRAGEELSVQARALEAGEETERMRRQMQQAGAIELRWREKLDQLEFEREIAVAKLQRERRQAENAFNRDSMAAMFRQAQAMVESGGVFAAAGSAPVLELQARRDEAVNALQTRIDETGADFDARRAELEAQRDEEMATVYE